MDRIPSPRREPVAPRFLSRQATPPRRKPTRPVLEHLEGRAVPATITVTSLADSGPGTLREAINEANTDQFFDKIEFAAAVRGEIALQTPLPALSSPIALVGPGSSELTITRDLSVPIWFGLWSVTREGQAKVSGLSWTNGFGIVLGGGAIMNEGSLTVIDSVFTGNHGGMGGAISNFGTLMVADSLFYKNVSSAGGAIANRGGDLTVVGSTLRDNLAASFNPTYPSSDSAGGAIYSGMDGINYENPRFSTTFILNCVIQGNSAGSGGGVGVYHYQSMVVIENSEFVGNWASQQGGAVLSYGNVDVKGSTFRGNVAGVHGGAFGQVDSGALKVENSTVSGNYAGYYGGGFYLWRPGASEIRDTTISGNTAGERSDGIYYDLSFPKGTEAPLTLRSTILSGRPGYTTAEGKIVSLGHNLFSDTPNITLDPTDLLNTDPLLGPLADNGGPTWTHALLPGSPAIDAGVAVPGVATDQRGVARPQGSAPDIGAFESRGFTVNVGGGSGQSAVVGAPFAAPLTVSVASPYGEPVAGGTVTFVAPGLVTLSGNPAVIGADGLAGVSATAGGTIGAYTVTAQTAGAAGVAAFDLTNVAVPVPPVLPAPTVVSFQRVGVHWRPTRLVLRFSAAMDAARAENLTNYLLVSAGSDGRFGTADDRRVSIGSAAYDAATRSVRLAPVSRLPLHRAFRLTVNGTPPDGLTDTDGTYLGGEGADRPGTNYVSTFGRPAPVKPLPVRRARRVRNG